MFRFRRKKKSSDPVAVVQRFVDAANRHDAQGVAECLHPDFDSIQPIYPSRNFRGSDQVRRNWQAIFQSEPGFRLTLLRSASTDGTVWVELHGAGKDVEVAGVFIMGVENNLVRWARVYSAVVEQEIQGPVETAEQPPVAVAADDGVTDARVAAELRQAVDAGRLRVVAGAERADAAAFAPEPETDGAPDPFPADDSLGTGDVPVTVVAEEAMAEELVLDDVVAEDLVAQDLVLDDVIRDDVVEDDIALDDLVAGEPEPVERDPWAPDDEGATAARIEAATEASLDDLLGEAPAPEPPPPGGEPVVELVRPAAEAAFPADEGPGAPDGEEPTEPHDSSGEASVLELKPEGRFGPTLPRP